MIVTVCKACSVGKTHGVQIKLGAILSSLPFPSVQNPTSRQKNSSMHCSLCMQTCTHYISLTKLVCNCKGAQRKTVMCNDKRPGLVLSSSTPERNSVERRERSVSEHLEMSQCLSAQTVIV